MVDQTADIVVREYEKKREVYRDFLDSVAGLVENLVKSKGVHLHLVQRRLKTTESLKVKLADRKYTSLPQVTDLAGIRIITYFEDEISKVASIVKTEFEVDWINSEDTVNRLDPSQFGYRSIHYVVRLLSSRRYLTEYQRFASMVAEIQMRSILQHAWAEIEHDLGYKSEAAVPQEFRRRFARLAGQFEVADEAFIHLRNDLTTYLDEVPKRIAQTPQEVEINQPSLLEYVHTDGAYLRKVREFAEMVQAEPMTPMLPREMAQLFYSIRYAGMDTIGKLKSAIAEDGERASKLFKAFHSREKWMQISRFMPLWFICYIRVGRNGSPERFVDFMRSQTLSPTPSEPFRLEFGEKIISALREIDEASH